MKTIFYSLAGLLFALCFAPASLAQTDKLITTSEHPAKAIATTKAIQRFQKQFPITKDEYWKKDKQGYSVSFKCEGMKQLAFLDRQGRCFSLIRYYGESQLPKAVRHLVRSSYYDFAITGVTEVTYENVTGYFVMIDDGKTIKTIRVINGEMDEFELYHKAA